VKPGDVVAGGWTLGAGDAVPGARRTPRELNDVTVFTFLTPMNWDQPGIRASNW
jgi:hypothetical protein